MSRYVFLTASAIFAGLLVTLAIAVAQRDSRISHALESDSTPEYANQSAMPIPYLNNKAPTSGDPIWPDTESSNSSRSGKNLSSITNSHSPGAVGSIRDPGYATQASYLQEASEVDLTIPSVGTPSQRPTGRLAEPPKFDASRIFTRRNSDGAMPTAKLLPPVTSKLSDNAKLPDNALPTFNGSPQSFNPPSKFGSDSSSMPNALRINEPMSDPASDLISSANELVNSNADRTNADRTNPVENRLPLVSVEPTYPEPNLPRNDALSSVGTSPSINNSLAPSDLITNVTPRPVATLGNPQPMNDYNSSRSVRNEPSVESRVGQHRDEVGFTPLTHSRNARTSGAPGNRQFDGSQNPSLEIQKRAPNEVQVGIPATFTVVVRNVGNATAFDVQVLDTVPRGSKFVRALPEAQRNGPDGLTWNLGEMAAGQDKSVTIELVPESEGEIGSVASVTFAAQASVRTISTQPKLVVKQITAPTVLGGESARIMIEVSNTGTGTAKDVELEAIVPPNLRHPTGSSKLGLSIGDLAPGEFDRREIELTAVTAGKVSHVIRATSMNAATFESAAALEIVSPKLDVQLAGAKLRHLERPVTYQATIKNNGTAVATDIDLTLYLPRGLQFNSAAKSGTYLPEQHAVVWNLAELGAGLQAETEVTLLPVEEGKFVLRLTCDSESVRAEPVEREVVVEGQSELTFTIEDDNDPIETDEITTYVIKITNIGTRADQDVQLVIELPDGASLEQVSAPMKHQESGRGVLFAPIAQMQSKDQLTVRLSVRHVREGTHVVRASLKSKLRPVPVIKDESTQVYRDQ